jgi:hypothetical protein
LHGKFGRNNKGNGSRLQPFHVKYPSLSEPAQLLLLKLELEPVFVRPTELELAALKNKFVFKNR